MTRAPLVALAALTAIGGASPARAEPAEPGWQPGHVTTSHLPGEVKPDDTIWRNDGVYGRFDGFFDVALDGGAELARDGTGAALLTSIHYFSTAGIYAGFVDSLGGTVLGSARLASLGVDLRPAFLPRWSNDMEGASSVLDLAVDSISLSLGGYLREPKGGTFGDARGIETSLGFGVPLAAWSEGPWLGARCVLRWDDPFGKDAERARAAALVTFGWRFAVVR